SNRAFGSREDVPGQATLEMDVSPGSTEVAANPDIGAANECSFRLSLACSSADAARMELKIEAAPSLGRGAAPGTLLGPNSSRVFLAKSSPWAALEPGSSRLRDPFVLWL